MMLTIDSDVEAVATGAWKHESVQIQDMGYSDSFPRVCTTPELHLPFQRQHLRSVGIGQSYLHLVCPDLRGTGGEAQDERNASMLSGKLTYSDAVENSQDVHLSRGIDRGGVSQQSKIYLHITSPTRRL